jgi:hypothetical protein
MIKFIGLGIIVLLYFLIDGYLKQKQRKKKYGLPDSIKLNYYELKVPSNKIEVYTREYLEETEIDGSIRIKAADALYDNNRNFTRGIKYASALIYHHTEKGKIFRVNSETIDLSKDELQRIIQKQEMVSIYFDKKVISNYYFDLSFLKNYESLD